MTMTGGATIGWPMSVMIRWWLYTPEPMSALVPSFLARSACAYRTMQFLHRPVTAEEMMSLFGSSLRARLVALWEAFGC